ncbi:hypothetical protein MCOR27_010941 [Pyricularia oryzae]|uniref:Profilin n=5 Tax=Pyricularia TaxID=48558 RepID=A0ABQ8NSA0_PYRGI|nr:profilin [Pyricularia oryzae 70-15]ELQ40149.1 profilin [Pyricularia oryzae Y34]KAH8847437.1 hypothetical protein MCOR01_000869 [Pyricularia oryzae]KAI6300842.1 hypothetical protein MCOR33_003468 [Pyricularia grisea]EHA52188.1 profilin [Pyricularia oryzae 70-15]KAH9428367.1 hypothetical protein MCOR02_010921 [Pyricularia oryzae]
MSWQGYVDQSLVGSGHIDKAAIISAAGDSTWATSADFTIEPAEMKTIADILDNKAGAQDKAHSDGIYIAKERYVVARIEDNTIYARQGRSGVAIAKTSQAILVGHHNETTQAGNASQTVGALVDYLKPLGF